MSISKLNSRSFVVSSFYHDASHDSSTATFCDRSAHGLSGESKDLVDESLSREDGCYLFPHLQTQATGRRFKLPSSFI